MTDSNPTDNTNVAGIGLIPQSTALSEADPESLTIIMSMNPEDYNDGHIARIVGALRAQRERFAQAKQTKPQRTKATAGGKAEAILKTTAASADDLGF